MMRPQATFKLGKHAYTLLAVLSARKKAQNSLLDNSKNQRSLPLPVAGKSPSLAWNADSSEREQALKTFGNRPAQEFSDLVTAGQLEVQVLESPTRDELLQTLEGLEPEIVYFQGEQATGTEEIGPLELNDCQISSPESLISLFGAKLPEVVYLESSCTSKLGEALHTTGVPFVIFWKSSVTYPLATHFRHALLAVLRSSATQVWNAFQLASASFRFHCGHLKSQGITYAQQKGNTMGPAILGDSSPNLKDPPKAMESGEGEGSPSASPTIKIHDDETELRLLICAECRGQDSTAIGAIEDGLNALLAVEVKGIRLLHRVSAPPPASAPSTLVRGVVTMRCELCTLNFARISLFVSGSAQTCFDDQMLEYSIKKDLLQKGVLVSPVLAGGDIKSGLAPELRRSTSVACGTAVLGVKFRTPAWAIQVLRQLAPEISFRSLVALGVAGVQGFPVAAFQKEDAERLLSLKSNSLGKHDTPVTSLSGKGSFCQLPFWFNSAVPSRKRRRISDPGKFYFNDNLYFDEDIKSSGPSVHQQSGKYGITSSSKPDLSLAAAMKPVPHANLNRNMPFVGAVLAGAHNGWAMKVTLPNGAGGKVVRPNSTFGPLGLNSSSGLPMAQSRQTVRAPSPAQMLSLNPIPMKKHGCNRHPIHECSEEEFLKDVMHFLMSRGHSRLVPSTTVESFPDVILNGKRLDIYNLYREVVSRGGFYVGNGINWKGQVFSKMRNHTLINKMTGVGNTLKKHYETYLLEYELAHDDVAGECCILCHSCAAGDWVNCGICGEWAHFGCDKRNGLGAFKDYAKTDGLEYICPRCTVSNGRGATGKKRIGSALGGYP